MRKRVMREKVWYIKYFGLFLCWMIGMNVSANLICVDWYSDNDAESFVRSKRCFYPSGTGQYCVQNGAWLINPDTGDKCYALSSDCVQITEFWETPLGNGSGCGSNGYFASLPLSDTFFPFFLLLSGYGICICFRKRNAPEKNAVLLKAA